MKIESLIRRPEGTKVELDNILYHFVPKGEDARHIAEVEREAHIRTFLAVPEGYQPVEGEKVSKKLQEQLEEESKLNGSAVHAAKYDFHGEEVKLDDIVLMAFDDSGLTREEWNELDDQKRYVYLDKTIASLKGEEKEPIEIVPADSELPGAGQPSPEAGGDTTIKTDLPQPENIEEANDSGQELDRDALALKYKEKFGRKPHHSLSAERIKQALDQDDE